MLIVRFITMCEHLLPSFCSHSHTQNPTHTEARWCGVGGRRCFFVAKLTTVCSVIQFQFQTPHYRIITLFCLRNDVRFYLFLCNSANKYCTPCCSTMLTNFLVTRYSHNGLILTLHQRHICNFAQIHEFLKPFVVLFVLFLV